jgi:hypothetical protein
MLDNAFFMPTLFGVLKLTVQIKIRDRTQSLVRKKFGEPA